MKLKNLKKLILRKILVSNKLILFNQLIKYFKMPKDIFIWHCARGRCGAIITKTNKPFLDDKIYWCKRCNTKFTQREVLKHNKKNILRFVNSL